MAGEPLVKRLAQWVKSFDGEKIPAEVALETKLHLLDTIGGAIAASEEEAFEATHAAVQDLGGKPDCSVIGTDYRTSLTHAILINGALIRCLDQNDIYVGPRQNGHPSDNIAVALSCAELAESSGAELLATIVLSYEIQGRIDDLVESGGPWDHVTVSSIVAPAVAGRLLNLSAEQIANAIAISAAHGNTLGVVRFGQLSGAKNLADAIVGANGALTVVLAKHGLTGPAEIFESPRGLSQAMFRGVDFTPILRPAASPYRIMDVNIKAYPCIGTAQTVVAAAVKARGLLQRPAGEVESVLVRMADIPFVNRQLADTERRYPRTRETADHSFYYLAAIGLLDGTVSVEGFKKQRWLDEDVQAMMARITIVPDANLNVHTPGTFPSVIEVTTRDGAKKIVEMIHAPGSIKNRMSPAEVQEKFCNNCGTRVAQDRQDEIIRQVLELEKLGSAAVLMKSLQF
jgi:2-methylcitrate dehydratase